tara:strand:+ start:208 stop:561 length:354 start_codon:yes stop_codon:yes gene_type:complete
MDGKVDTGCSDVELIMEMMNDDSSFVLHDEDVESNQNEAYYEAKAYTIIKNLKNEDDYFFFLKAVLKKFTTLPLDRKEEIKKIMGIQKEVIVKEKIIYKQQKSKKNTKPKLNTQDDY